MDENRVVKTDLEPPHDIEAEKAVLGSMMQSKDAVSDVIDKLKPDDFYLKEHQEIYKAFVEMFRRSIGIDLTTAYSQLKKMNTLELVGGMSYLGRLSSDAIVPSNARYYADTVLAKSNMRRLIDEADLIRKRAYAEEGTSDEILDFAEQRIFQIAQGSQARNYIDINTVLVENINYLRELEKNKGQLPGITTGFIDVDKTLGGLHKSDLIVLAARPGVGKTAFALNIAYNAAKAGHSVLIFSLEMSSTQLGQRLLSMASNVDSEHLKMGDLSMDEWEQISYAQDEFEDLKITIDDASDVSMLEIKNKCRRLKAEKGLDLVIIDYLQLMNLAGYGADNHVQMISALTRNIKILAKELDCPIILLSQMSRKVDGRSSGKPLLSDLRDSGSIEQDADIVIFLKRDQQEEDQEADMPRGGSNVCEVIIAKHRNGPVGTVLLTWIPRYTKFGNHEHGSLMV